MSMVSHADVALSEFWEAVTVNRYDKGRGVGIASRGDGQGEIQINHWALCAGGLSKSPEPNDPLNVRIIIDDDGKELVTVAAKPEPSKWERVLVKWYDERRGLGLVQRYSNEEVLLTADVLRRCVVDVPKIGERLDIRWQVMAGTSHRRVVEVAYTVGFV